MLIHPKVRGFLCTTAHPVGCHQNVSNQINYVTQQPFPASSIKRVLIIGASTGYGLASRIVAAFGLQAQTIGVFFEKQATDKRTASPGWYNSASFEEQAQAAGLYGRSFNGDAFSADMKQRVIQAIQTDWDGQVDLIIYSLASPRRTDPEDGTTYHSTLKPVGNPYSAKTVDILSGKVSDVTLPPATDEEIKHTQKVMGGEDWALWIEALAEAGVLSSGAQTVAYSYIGPEMTYPIYRRGTIGLAKDHLESTAKQLNDRMQQLCQGRALISVNKGLVTQASAAIPVVPLYMSILYKLMKQRGTHEGCIEQMVRLFQSDLLRHDDSNLDEFGRIRLDDLEMHPGVQAEIVQIWQDVSNANLERLSDILGYRQAFFQLFGFEMEGVDYSVDVEIQKAIPSLQSVPA